ncbi:MAG: cob(I)yrinic acid a,c-diamide adenosyltransferase [Candidatus Delongbacteria bacterium]|nr:cob(I)yrinic acid a,c-diamide adenosyltransferase [Candidatus Delongbacteria bacterium]MCG2761150.1 cob(I)yrinic acid a,c-diamide adenosyltransferase [Candidatus Delongbacteria bacterium]
MEKGLIIINTGDGKGKSTAAFGILARALGHDLKAGVVQFIKSPGDYGEISFFKDRAKTDWYVVGRGFTWNSDNLERDKEIARKGFETACEMIDSDEYDLLVLDEITYITNYHFIEIDEFIEVLKNKPERLNIILTGRDADPKLIEIADTVTEMKKIKHCFDQGIKAKKGIEY